MMSKRILGVRVQFNSGGARPSTRCDASAVNGMCVRQTRDSNQKPTPTNRFDQNEKNQ